MLRHNVVGSHVILSFIPISVTAHFSLRAFYLNLLTWALCIKIITVELQMQLTSALYDPGGGYVSKDSGDNGIYNDC